MNEEKSFMIDAEETPRQPFNVAEQFTGIPGVFVGIDDTIKGFQMILNGEVDQYPEAAFNPKGTIQEVIEAGEKMLAEKVVIS